MTRREWLPVDVVLLSQDEQGRAYRVGNVLVVERSFAGKQVECRLPVDLEWLWSWMQLTTAACDQLAANCA